jgi:hypothetical protein
MSIILRASHYCIFGVSRLVSAIKVSGIRGVGLSERGRGSWNSVVAFIYQFNYRARRQTPPSKT